MKSHSQKDPRNILFFCGLADHFPDRKIYGLLADITVVPCVFVYLDCCNEAPQTEWLRQQ